MYIIVIGAGRTGSTVIDLATQDNNEVVVIERDTTLAEEVSASYDCLVINADAASKEILLEAGIEEADALISTTETDAVNLMVTMLGRDYGVDTLVSSVNNPTHIDLFEDLGVSIVENPTVSTASTSTEPSSAQPSVTSWKSLAVPRSSR